MCAGETNTQYRQEDAHFPCCTFGPRKITPDAERLSNRELNSQCEPKFRQFENADSIDRAEFADKTRTHVWLWCVPGMLFFVVWISLLQYLQHALAEAGNRQNINVSQYAVLVSNVGGVNIDDERLKDFGRYYGDVVAAFHIRNYGRYLRKNLEVCCESSSLAVCFALLCARCLPGCYSLCHQERPRCCVAAFWGECVHHSCQHVLDTSTIIFYC